MENIKNQLLRDPNTPPTGEIIAQGLGNANDAFVKFCQGLEEYGVSLMDWRYYNDGKSWLSKGEYKWTTARGSSKVKPIFWLSVWEGFFRVSFFFACGLQQKLSGLPVSREMKEIVANAKPMGNTMRFMPIVIDINSAAQLDDVYKLAQFRKIKVK